MTDTAIIWIDDVPLSVEFDHTPPEPATRCEPPVFAETEITGVFIGGHEVSGLLADCVHDSIQEKTEDWIAERRAESRREAAEDRAQASAEFAAFGGFLRC